MGYSRILIFICIMFLISNCAGVQDITVDIPQHKALEKASAISSIPPASVKVIEVREPEGTGILPGRIGERKTIGNISMGLVRINPPVGPLLTDMLRAELIAAGHRLVEDEDKVKITGQVRRFVLHTDVTPLYWDVIVNADMIVEAAASGRSQTSDYTAICIERTYVWPGEEIIARVIGACIADLAMQFRDDQAITAILNVP